MSQLHLSDEILMAFADGELEEPVAAALEQAMMKDPAITRRIADFLRSRRLIRSAFAQEAALDVPADLQAAVEAQIRDFSSGPDKRVQNTRLDLPKPGVNLGQKRWKVILPLAASLAAIAFGLASYFVGQQQNSKSPQADLVARLEDPLVEGFLSQTASGHEEELEVGRVRVVSTYRVGNGYVCREFTLQATSGKADAISCRNSRGWDVTFALAIPAGDEAYKPADGSDLISAYLQNVGASEPLVDGAETKALDQVR